MIPGSRILIVGAGDAGRVILSEYLKRGMISSIAGFADDDPAKAGSSFDGKRVLGTTADIEKIISDENIDEIIIAMPSAAQSALESILSRVMACSQKIGIHVLPEAERFFDAAPLVPALRSFTFTELFEREEYSISLDLMREKFSGRSVLVTGAGGSIGSEICRQLLKFDIKGLTAIGRGENSIYELAKSLASFLEQMEGPPSVSYRIADVKDKGMLARIFNEGRPDFVFHAAAHKHVPLMEFNEAEALMNNVGGTRNILELCAENDIARFIMVSTDKAVRPTSVMGASKRIAEITAGYYNRNHNVSAAIVRFGNVIGSRGSVVPLFREQILSGGPVTVTHPEVTRYFMSIPEASLLVLNAAAFSSGGEVYVLDMGKQFKVLDVARRLIELHGLAPGRDIEIKFTGLRPGEKLFEELFYDKGLLGLTGNSRIFILKSDGSHPPDMEIADFINSKLDSIHELDRDEIRGEIKKLVPEFEGENFSAGQQEERIVN